MADILIKNMEMPKEMECVEILLFYNGHCAFRKHERDEWVEAWAVALPEHHGRLIDADKILAEKKKKANGLWEWEQAYLISAINSAPVIVEATE